ncbi:hypothetical protein CHR55_31970 [Rhodococcus qingshengii]|uniref:Uncharacterized protein n=1 Tax=Rhodococcus qingshengii TaxID=334542 RepID=A0A2A5IZT8_RHOSG|nr:hypothetical protein CHR55_31970 [Rhodococcus qingshengii]
MRFHRPILGRLVLGSLRRQGLASTTKVPVKYPRWVTKDAAWSSEAAGGVGGVVLSGGYSTDAIFREEFGWLRWEPLPKPRSVER